MSDNLAFKGVKQYSDDERRAAERKALARRTVLRLLRVVSNWERVWQQEAKRGNSRALRLQVPKIMGSVAQEWGQLMRNRPGLNQYDYAGKIQAAALAASREKDPTAALVAVANVRRMMAGLLAQGINVGGWGKSAKVGGKTPAVALVQRIMYDFRRTGFVNLRLLAEVEALLKNDKVLFWQAKRLRDQLGRDRLHAVSTGAYPEDGKHGDSVDVRLLSKVVPNAVQYTASSLVKLNNALRRGA